MEKEWAKISDKMRKKLRKKMPLPAQLLVHLAQHVCSDDDTNNHFSPIIWINISEFNEREVYKHMLLSATASSIFLSSMS